VGVVGCGEIAQVMHLPYLRDLPGFAIQGLCDLSARQLGEVANRFGVPTDRRFSDPAELIGDPDVDELLVLTSGSHGEIALRAAASDVDADVIQRNRAATEALVDEALGRDVPVAARRAYLRFLGLLTHDTSIMMLAFGPPRSVLSATVWDEGNGLAATLDYGS